MNTPQVITCKGAVCWGIGEGVKLEEIEVDPPKASEVRVKMICASVCHTDISCINQGLLQGNYPLVLGHEGVGIVESIGEEVKNVKVGDVVIPLYVGECGECENCVSGKTNLCMRYPAPVSGLMPDDTSRLRVAGKMAYHVFSCATWCEYIVADVNYVIKVEPSINVAHASFISCAFSTGFGAAWKEAKVHKGSSVAVLGLGGVGLGAISGAKMMGARKIIGIDKNEMKRKKGEAFGMTHFINTSSSANNNKSVSDLVKELTDGMGVDYSFECIGVPPLLEEAMQVTKMGVGETIAIGTGREGPTLNYSTILYGRSMKGTIFGGIKPISDLPFITRNEQDFPLDELLTHEISLADVSSAVEIFEQPDCVKVVINM